MRKPNDYCRHRAQKLKEAHPELTYAAIAQCLGISKTTVCKYLQGFLQPKREFRRWSPNDTALLFAMAEVVPLCQIAKKLNRTERAVQIKAFCLGLSTYSSLDNYSAKYLAENLGMYPNRVGRWISRGLLVATKDKSTWRIRAIDFANFCRENPEISSQFDQEIVTWLSQGGKH